MPWAMQMKNSRLLKRRFNWPGSYSLGYSMLRCSGTSCVGRIRSQTRPQKRPF